MGLFLAEADRGIGRERHFARRRLVV
jgi:hypothetical protein